MRSNRSREIPRRRHCRSDRHDSLSRAAVRELEPFRLPEMTGASAGADVKIRFSLFDNLPLAFVFRGLRAASECPDLFCVRVLMRSSAVPALFFGCFLLGGCTSSSGPESLMAGLPSKETTSSVTPSAPVPQAGVGTQAIAAQPRQEVLAWGGPVPDEPKAFSAVTPRASLTQNAPEIRLPVPSQAAGMVRPAERPTINQMERPVQLAMAAAPAASAGARIRSRIFRSSFSDAKPINFGRVQPRHFQVHGVDVSRWQANINWPQLRARRQFRLHQGDGWRRPSRSDVPHQLAAREGGGHSPRRLPLLLLVPQRQRTGGLVHS